MLKCRKHAAIIFNLYLTVCCECLIISKAKILSISDIVVAYTFQIDEKAKKNPGCNQSRCKMVAINPDDGVHTIRNYLRTRLKFAPRHLEDSLRWIHCWLNVTRESECNVGWVVEIVGATIEIVWIPINHTRPQFRAENVPNGVEF